MAAYEQLCKQVAAPLVGIANAEEDDLVQEGRILVWQCLQRGIEPGAEIIRRKMLNWTRYLRRLDALEPVSYEQVLEGEATEVWSLYA